MKKNLENGMKKWAMKYKKGDIVKIKSFWQRHEMLKSNKDLIGQIGKITSVSSIIDRLIKSTSLKEWENKYYIYKLNIQSGLAFNYRELAKPTKKEKTDFIINNMIEEL